MTISRSYLRIVSTIFFIIVSALPYLDIFLSNFIDFKNYKPSRFANIETAIWTYSVCITPILLLVISKMNPYRFSYIAPFYTNTTMFCGLLFLDLNINISSDFVFRIITFILALILLILANRINAYMKLARLKEDVLDELIKTNTYEKK